MQSYHSLSWTNFIIAAFFKTQWRQPMRIRDRYPGTELSSAFSTSCSSLSSHSSSLTSSWPSSLSPSTSSERQSWRTTWTRIRNLVLTSPSKQSPCSFMFPLRPLGSGIVLLFILFSWKKHLSCRYHLWRLCTSAPFENFILLLIIMNTLLLMLKFEGAPMTYVDVLSSFNLFFTMLFTIEAVLKLTAFGPKVNFSILPEQSCSLNCSSKVQMGKGMIVI